MKYTYKTRDVHLCLKCESEYRKPWRMGNVCDPRCPHCGVYLNNLFGAPVTKRIRSERWVSTSVWYKPWTWKSGYWKTILGLPSNEEV